MDLLVREADVRSALGRRTRPGRRAAGPRRRHSPFFFHLLYAAAFAPLAAAMRLLPLCVAALLLPSSAGNIVVSVTDYGAVGDNRTDNTLPFRAAFAAVLAASGGEVRVPAVNGTPSIFKTAPFNLSSNIIFSIDAGATVWAWENSSAFPHVATPPSYLSSFPAWRHHPFVWAPNASNVTIRGSGVLNGAGPFWWEGPEKTQDTRPHLLELYNVSGAEVTGVTLQNSAFWTFRPIYSTNVHIHDMKIEELYGAGDNTGARLQAWRACSAGGPAAAAAPRTLSLARPPAPPPFCL